MEKRSDYLDIAKGFAIMSVVLWHIVFPVDFGSLLPIRSLFGEIWHVPVFFLISGFFIKEKQLLETGAFIAKKVVSIHFFTLCFYIPAIILHNFFIDIGFYSLSVDYGGKSVVFYEVSDFFRNVIMALFFAGREPILGPLWFAFVLCLAFIVLAVITKICSQISTNNYVGLRFVVCLFLAIVSVILSNKYHLTINRCSNTFVVCLLLLIGQYLFQEKKVKFDSWNVFLSALLLLWQCAVLNGKVYMNNNSFHDLSTLFCGSITALYVVCFISKKIERFWIGRVVKVIGMKSFYIMALHFFSYKIFAVLLNAFGEETDFSFLIPNVTNRAYLALGYFSFGIGMPLLFSFFVEKFKIFCTIVKKKST